MRVSDLGPESRRWSIDVGGVIIEFDLRESATFDHDVRDLLGPATVTTAPPDHVVSITAAPPPARPSGVERVDGFDLLLRPDFLWLEESGAVLRSVSNSSKNGPQLYLLHRAPTGQLGEPYLFVMTFFNLIAIQNAWVPLHSALVQSPSGALLLVGASGRGKSTSSGAALRAGWPVAGDDVTFLRYGAQGIVEVLGLPRSLALPDEAIPQQHRRYASATADYRVRRRLARFDRPDHWQPLVGCVEVDHGTRSQSDIAGLSPLGLVQALIRCEALASQDQNHVKLSMQVVNALTRLPGRRLLLGTNSESRMESTANALTVLASEFRPLAEVAS